jgi:Legionella pneumophila major outer membrane protein precursor
MRKARPIVLALTLLLPAWVIPSRCLAQDPPPAAPVPVVPNMPVPSGPAPAPPVNPYAPAPPALAAPLYAPGPAVPAGPPPGGLAPPPPGGYFQDRNGPLLRGDPLLDRPLSPPPGWFTNLEFDLIGPHISNQLASFVNVAGITDIVALPTAPLEWVGAPSIEVGYRMAGGLGEFTFAYRSIVSSGRALLVDFEGPGNDGFLNSRLNMNIFDLTYGTREYSLAPLWDLNWKVGARIAAIYFDSLGTGLFLEQRESSNFVGAGPIAGFEVARRFDGWPGVAVFGRLDGALLVGRVHQAFEETVDFAPILGGATDDSSTQVVPVLAMRLGLSYTPPWEGHWARFAIGYEFQQYWNIGRAAGSHADLQTNGVFFRAELGY